MLKIRDAFVHELDFIRQQRVAAYEEYSLNIPQGHWELLKQSISSDADVDTGVQLIIAELDGEIVGSVVLCPENTDAYKGLVDMSEFPEIRMLAVTPKARKKGVATALIKECIRRAKQTGAQYIGLHTADFMKSAVRLYERMGFKRVPQLDFEPANDGIVVKAYRLPIA
ncbi:MAG: GNAT family N-acetyltransferase [Alicyclobacillus macrosporangiidus]|uniref:GNAT family N-acetyltransferase n=1 Tax=Alicyclobacillus macrosporangiidus TaxID=392015 RepID=UPI0026F04ABE|nr:GNAT family N-acetyltransferase [Alicyclobacillus macrosporangiidus]MCL6599127.1 GNAT family N-acetyltransferase [Alicyclobacillus macrosporangiidus]